MLSKFCDLFLTLFNDCLLFQDIFLLIVGICVLALLVCVAKYLWKGSY